MNPVVTAATIGVGGTVIVGVAGFGASILNTRRTIAHARETRIWDKRAEAYVDAIAAVHYRHAKRDLDMRTYPLDAESARREGEYLAAYTPPDWYALEGRLLAFASQPVIKAVQASSAKHMYAMNALKVSQYPDAVERAREAQKAADNADDAVIEVIRAELQGRGAPLPDRQSPPAEQPAEISATPEA